MEEIGRYVKHNPMVNLEIRVLKDSSRNFYYFDSRIIGEGLNDEFSQLQPIGDEETYLSSVIAQELQEQMN